MSHIQPVKLPKTNSLGPYPRCPGEAAPAISAVLLFSETPKIVTKVTLASYLNNNVNLMTKNNPTDAVTNHHQTCSKCSHKHIKMPEDLGES